MKIPKIGEHKMYDDYGNLIYDFFYENDVIISKL